MAQTIFADLQPDCRLTLRDGQAFDIPAETCRSIKAHRGEFLAGAIGPDAFPDIAMGQTVIHPGIEDGWVTADWLEHLLEGADTDAELAFSAGFLLHAAADIFAHSYVNNYAGDVFILQDEQVVERRHTLLEKYIDRHVPDFPFGETGAALMSVPADFLADRFIFDPAAAAANRAQKAATHLVLLREARAFVQGRKKDAESRATAEQRRYNEAVRSYWAAETASSTDPDDRAARRAFKRARKAYERASYRLRSAFETLAFAQEWDRSITLLTERYILASLATSRAIIEPGLSTPPLPQGEEDIALSRPDDALNHYRRWYRCYSATLAGEPAAIGDARCAAMTALDTESSFASLRRMSLLPAGASKLYVDYRAWRRQIARDAARSIVKLADRMGWVAAGLVRDLARSRPVTGAELDAVFRAAPKDKSILMFPDGITPLIHQDLGLAAEGGKLDPSAFKALDYAVILGKVALLDRERLREVVAAYGGDPARLRTSGQSARYSILLDTVRSLDGNHQWQEYGMPHPRRSTETPPEPQERHFGYGPRNSTRRQGFSLYADPELRRTVFAKLFPTPFEGAILEHPAFAEGAYPYASCPDDPLRPRQPASGQTDLLCSYP